jgi:NTE family protein
MNRLFVIACVFWISLHGTPAHAADRWDAACINLALGGGGARGAAHIGVLKVLERERIPVCGIAGTSAGSLVGALYAVGYAPDDIERILARTDWDAVLTDELPREAVPLRVKSEDLRSLTRFRLGVRDGSIALPRGLVDGQSLLALVRNLLLPAAGIARFDELPIAFRAVATDIETGRSAVLDAGDLPLAVRASMSVPAVFAPVEIDGRLLVDGGISDNVPIDVARSLGGRVVVAVDVTEPLAKREDLDSPLAITYQMVTALMMDRTQRRVQSSLREGDVLVQPELDGLKSVDFANGQRAVPAGAAAAEAAVAALRAFAVDESTWARWQARRRAMRFPDEVVTFVRALDGSAGLGAHDEIRLAALVDRPLDEAAVAQVLRESYASGRFAAVDWRATRDARDRTLGLAYRAQARDSGPTQLNFGLRVSDNFQGDNSYLLSAGLTHYVDDEAGSELRGLFSIGSIIRARGEWFRPLGASPGLFLRPQVDYSTVSLPVVEDGMNLGTVRARKLAAGVDLGWLADSSTEVRLGLFRGRERLGRGIGSFPVTGSFENDLGWIGSGFTRDTLDDGRFPTRGYRLDVQYDAYRTWLGSGADGEALNATWDQAFSRGPHTVLLGARTSLRYGEPVLLQAGDFLGGLTQLSGYADSALLGPRSVLARSVYYRRFGDSGPLGGSFYLGASLEAGNVFERLEPIDASALILAGSIFAAADTPLGPLFLGFGRADSGESSVYLGFGSLLRPRR